MIVSKDGTLWRWDGFISEKSKETEKWLDYKTRIIEIDFFLTTYLLLI